MTSNRVGRQLGNYRLLRLLGKGGFAEVYLGKHSYLESYAALKILQLSLSEKEAQRFQAEAQTLVRLIHPHIVRVLDFFVEQGMPVLVMDYAPGGTLRQHHPCGSCLSLPTVVGYVSQISRALHYAHSHGVIHRDVKPENILLDAHHRLLLGDFGLALLAPSPQLFSTQELAGTLPYMAPEQLRGKPSFASDQYALGTMVYEWLCGECPFTGSYWEVIHQQISVLPRPLCELCPKLAAAVDAVVLKALAKDPAERFSNVQAFAEALEHVAQGHQEEFEPALSSHERAVSTIMLPETLAALSPTASAKLSLPEMLAAFSARESGLLSSAGLAPVSLHMQIFLSAPPADASIVARLQADLQVWGIHCLNEQKNMASTIFDHESAVDAVRGAAAVVVVVSSRTRSSRMVQDHLHQAAMYRQQIICFWIEGEDLATLLLEPWVQQTIIDVIDARNCDYSSALNELAACLKKRIPHSKTEMPILPVRYLSWEPRNPYKGLRAFTQDDADDFFGRDTLVYELVETVREMLTAMLPSMSGTRLVAVLGPSGSGKSSVVMAGLLPRLQKDALSGSASWVYLKPVVPGAHPLEALALAFALHMPQSSLKTICEDLQGDSTRGLHLLARHLVAQSDRKVVLLVDQFEEVFSNMVSEQERHQFIDLLVTAATEPSGPVIVLLTLRADYADRPMLHPALSRLIEAHSIPVLPMDLQDLRAVIEKPAALPTVQLEFEGDLVGDLLFETQKQAGALPLLSFTLELLFQLREGHVLTMQAYKHIGGVKGALAKWAEQTYIGLPGDEYRTRARAIFLRLIDPGLSEQDTTRRRASLSEFMLSDTHETRLLGETIDAFITARLLTTSEVAGITTIEVSHEALIREWTRLTMWLREARDDMHLRQVISQDAAAWQRRKRSADRLYRGSQLKEAKTWAKRNMTSEQEMAFLYAGRARQIRMRVICSMVACLIVLVAVSIGLFSIQARHHNIVSTNANDGPGSLRQIISTAHAGDVIRFDASLKGKTIYLQHGNLNIDRNLRIVGLGENDVGISGNSGSTMVIRRGVTATIEAMSFQNSATEGASLLTNEGNLTLNDVGVVHNTTSLKSKNGFVGYAGGGIKNSGKLTLTNSLVAYNTTSTCDTVGGINNSGTLVMENSSVMDNGIAPQCDSSHMEAGSGIVNDIQGKVTLKNSIVANNWASGSGGGIRNKGNLTAINTLIADNEVTGNGGGVSNQGNLTVTNSMIAHNTAMATVPQPSSEQANGGVGSPIGQGGGIYNARTLVLTNSTVSNNVATAINVASDYKGPATFFSGGGIFSGVRAQITMANSTIADNTAYTDGGGIVNEGGDITASFCTIYGNNAQSSGGGVVTADAMMDDREYISAHLYMKANIVVGNQAAVQAGIVGEVTTDGYNLMQGFFKTLFADPHHRHANDLAAENASLGMDAILRDNGGQSWLHPWTHRLLPVSAAIDRIPASTCDLGSYSTDELGTKRPQGKACDIGAYEYVVPPKT